MSSGKKNEQDKPFGPLGEQLKRLRESARESLAEVSGAVEIDVEVLGQIESGTDRPSEDILLLLISHFDTKEDTASRLWKLAGFEEPEQTTSRHDMPKGDNPAVMVLPGDARIVYTDMVHVMVNDYGVIMNFMQGGGPNSQPLAVARVGMSKEHARSVLEILQKTLAASEPKALPESTSSVRRTQSRKKSQ